MDGGFWGRAGEWVDGWVRWVVEWVGGRLVAGVGWRA